MSHTDNKDKLIFTLTVAPANAGERDKEYTIFEGEPSFFNLPKEKRKDFINREIIKVKEFINREYRPPRELTAH
ncbi:MAG: hypothetical protein GY950_16500 [bacterium]|nr:hypothetical protein [bacterium]